MQSHARDVVDFIEDYAQKGIKEVICTDISKDGMLNGPSTGLYEEVLSRTPVELIGSGGVSSIQDLKDLASIGCAGAIVGKAIYEKKISLEKLSELC
jgi:phosphoribosylformimino-5-aminoimidazole carboxamide ribotide isomerase